jgi:putative membrane protein
MTHILVSWIVTTLAILVVTYVLPGVRVSSLGAAVVAAAILGILNALVRPILIILTLPLTIVTLGLFLVGITGLFDSEHNFIHSALHQYLRRDLPRLAGG